MTNPTFENNFDDLLDQPPKNTISDTLNDVDLSNPFHDAVSPLKTSSSATNYVENSQIFQKNFPSPLPTTSVPNPLELYLNVPPIQVKMRENEEVSRMEEGRSFEEVDVSSVNGLEISLPYDSRSSESEVESFDDKHSNLAAHRAHNGFSSPQKLGSRCHDRESPPTFDISVEDPQQIGDTFTGYILYNVRTRTTSPDFKSDDFTVRRRYRDFLWLYNQLTYNKPGVIVPPVPEKHIYVLAAARFQTEFVENRRKALEKCLRKITSHPELQCDSDLRLFLESDTFTTDVKRNESKGVLRSLSDAMSSATAFNKFTETDEWFETRRNQLDILESQLKALVKSVEAIVKQRKDLGGATKEFGESMLTLACAEYEKNKLVASNLTLLGDLQHKIKDLHELQAQRDVITLENTVEEYIRLIGSIKVTFNSRAKCYNTWQNVIYELHKKKANYERIKTQGRLRQDKLTLMLADIVESERKVEDCRHEFERVTKLIKAEIDRFDKEKVEDFKNSLEAFLESMVETQKQIIVLWESYFKSLEV
ncbi:hypothetical protein G9A89_007578 [Geosiphon pyriformis]|nr:hypothetical protein G9A89_007578 [Geosiphon pyriformis]